MSKGVSDGATDTFMCDRVRFSRLEEQVHELQVVVRHLEARVSHLQDDGLDDEMLDATAPNVADGVRALPLHRYRLDG
jgi:hypothetical protein